MSARRWHDYSRSHFLCEGQSSRGRFTQRYPPVTEPHGTQTRASLEPCPSLPCPSLMGAVTGRRSGDDAVSSSSTDIHLFPECLTSLSSRRLPESSGRSSKMLGISTTWTDRKVWHHCPTRSPGPASSSPVPDVQYTASFFCSGAGARVNPASCPARVPGPDRFPRVPHHQCRSSSSSATPTVAPPLLPTHALPRKRLFDCFSRRWKDLRVSHRHRAVKKERGR